MSENDGLNDEICMAFINSRVDLALKEGEENRVYNAIALDKTDIVISAIDFTIQFMENKK